MSKCKTILLAAAVFPFAAQAAAPTTPIADGSLLMTLVCHATYPGAKGDDAKDADLTISPIRRCRCQRC